MTVQNKKLAILQPQIPHYREEFFIELRKKVATDIFVTESPKKFIHKGFNLTTIPVKNCKCPMFSYFIVVFLLLFLFSI